MPDSKPAARKVLPSDPAVVGEYLEYHAPHKFPGKESTDDHASAKEVQYGYKTGPKVGVQQRGSDFAPKQKPDPMLRNLNKSADLAKKNPAIREVERQRGKGSHLDSKEYWESRGGAPGQKPRIPLEHDEIANVRQGRFENRMQNEHPEHYTQEGKGRPQSDRYEKATTMPSDYSERAFHARAMKDIGNLHDAFFGSSIQRKSPKIAEKEQALGSKVREYEAKNPQKKPTSEPREHEEASKGPEEAAAMDRRIGRRQNRRSKPNTERLSQDISSTMTPGSMADKPRAKPGPKPAAKPAPKKDYFNKSYGSDIDRILTLRKVAPLAAAAVPALASAAGGAGAAGAGAAGAAGAGASGAGAGMSAGRTAMNAASMMPSGGSSDEKAIPGVRPAPSPAVAANLGSIPPTASTTPNPTRPIMPNLPPAGDRTPTKPVAPPMDAKAFKTDEKAASVDAGAAGEYKDPSSYNKEQSDRMSKSAPLTSAGMNAPIGTVRKDYSAMVEGRCSTCKQVTKKCSC